MINDNIDFLEEDGLFTTCFIEGEMYGWKLAKDFSSIQIYLRFPSLKEIRLDNFYQDTIDDYLVSATNLSQKTLEGGEPLETNQLKSLVYDFVLSKVEDDFHKSNFFYCDPEIFEEEEGYEKKYVLDGQLIEFINLKRISSSKCFVNDKLFFTQKFELKDISRMFMKDYVKLFGVEDIGIRGQEDSSQSLVNTYEWDIYVLGFNGKGWFRNLGASGIKPLYHWHKNFEDR